MRRVSIALHKFTGKWAITRELRDESSGANGRLEGIATYKKLEDNPLALLYEENGILQMSDAPPLTAERRYIWRQGVNPKSINVHFEDDSPFHSVDLDRTMPYATHFCHPDSYDVSYDFRGWPNWVSEWRVKGPRKDYRLWSSYKFIGPLDGTQPLAPTGVVRQRASRN